MFGFKNGKSEPGDVGSKSPLEQLTDLKPGDIIDLWEVGSLVVKTRLDCEETVGDRTYSWTWWFLDDKSILEVSADGHFRYVRHEIEHQGSALYQTLVAQDGILVRFEERVRDESVDRRPVHLTVGEREFRVTNTGTFRVVNRQGDSPPLLPWHGIGNRADDNVYFSLVESADEDSVVLGIWTDHVCLSYGAPLDETTLTAIYPRA